MKKTKKNTANGVTLIALVITITVSLILIAIIFEDLKSDDRNYSKNT